MMLSEPTIIPEGTENPEFWLNDQLNSIFFASQNLGLTAKAGAITQGDKAGNLSANYVVYTSNAVANSEDSVTHTLGRVPQGYVIVSQDKAAVLYDSGTPATATTIYWKSSVATVAWKVLVF